MPGMFISETIGYRVLGTVSDERYVGRGERTSIDAMNWQRSLREVNGRRRGRPFVLPPQMLEMIRRFMLELRSASERRRVICGECSPF